MSKFKVCCRCGLDARKILYTSWIESNLCIDCWRWATTSNTSPRWKDITKPDHDAILLDGCTPKQRVISVLYQGEV